MASIGDILYSLGLIATGLSAGYLYRNKIPHGATQSEEEIRNLRRRLQITAIFYLNPFVFGGAIWSLDMSDVRIFALPFLGAFAVIFGGVLGYIASRIFNQPRKQRGVMVTCGSFTNIGSIGSLITYIILGEAAVAIIPFYKFFETFLYYGIGFPYAKSMSEMEVEHESAYERLRNILSDKVLQVTLASWIVGLSLNLLGVERPAFFSLIIRVFIPLVSLSMLSSIGMAIRFEKMREYVREASAIALIKFVAIPTSVYLVASWVGLGAVNGGLPLKVVTILASMPVAFTAMVPPTLYDLDVDLANTAWMMTTGLLLVVVPVLWLIL
jgi:predicted permease